jgi:hypothetical protein
MLLFHARFAHVKICTPDADETDRVLVAMADPSVFSSITVQLSCTLGFRLYTYATKLLPIVVFAFTGQKTSADDMVVDWFDTPHCDRSTMLATPGLGLQTFPFPLLPFDDWAWAIDVQRQITAPARIIPVFMSISSKDV